MDQINRAHSGVRGKGMLCTAAIWLCLLPVAQAQPGARPPAEAPEYAVKAAFLLNFTRFVQWPPDAFEEAGSPFAICILGDDPFGSTLDQLLKGEQVEGRRIVVRRLSHPPPPKSCQILYVGDSERSLPTLFDGLGRGVLTVGAQPGFCRDGGIIGFAIEDRHVRFDINREAAANAGLQLSARLLRVARFVR